MDSGPRRRRVHLRRPHLGWGPVRSGLDKDCRLLSSFFPRESPPQSATQTKTGSKGHRESTILTPSVTERPLYQPDPPARDVWSPPPRRSGTFPGGRCPRQRPGPVESGRHNETAESDLKRGTDDEIRKVGQYDEEITIPVESRTGSYFDHLFRPQ